MNYAVIRSLVGAAVVSMAFVGTASATKLTNPAGLPLPVGTPIKAKASGHLTLHPPIGSITCAESELEGSISDAGGYSWGSTRTVRASVADLHFMWCNGEVLVKKGGSLELHGTGLATGVLTSSGAEVTIVYLGFHCIFTTNNTAIGTLTGSNVTKGTAVLDISATIPRTGGSSGAFCGSTSAWTGKYVVTAPDPVFVD